MWEQGVGVRRSQTGKLSWHVKYHHPKFGQRKELLRGCKNATEARGALAKRQTELFDGTYKNDRPERDLRFSDFIPTFNSMKSAQPIGKKYASDLKLHLEPFFGKMALRDIKRSDCIAYYNSRLTKAAVATANNEMKCLSAFLGAALADQIIESSPAWRIKLRNPNNRRKKIFAATQIETMFEKLETHKWGKQIWIPPLVYVLYYTGARINSVLSLEWKDIDFDSGVVTFTKNKNGHEHQVPMHAVLEWKLQQWREATKGIVVKQQWVFPAPRDHSKKMHPSSIRKSWDNFCAVIGVEPADLNRHDFRRNFTSQLANSGVNTLLLKEIVGHRTLAMTERYATMQVSAMQGALKHLPGRGTAVVQSVNHQVEAEQNPGNDVSKNTQLIQAKLSS